MGHCKLPFLHCLCGISLSHTQNKRVATALVRTAGYGNRAFPVGRVPKLWLVFRNSHHLWKTGGHAGESLVPCHDPHSPHSHGICVALTGTFNKAAYSDWSSAPFVSLRHIHNR